MRSPDWSTPDGRVKLYCGDSLQVVPSLPPSSVDCIVTDPPYGLSFMGKDWDHGIPGVAFWQSALDALKPSGYALIFGGTRTYHRLACAVEDAGFEVRDCIMWIFGSGFPKGKGCLKPAYEPILLCRKPGKVLPLGIDECRVGTEKHINSGQPMGYRYGPSGLVGENGKTADGRDATNAKEYRERKRTEASQKEVTGRWPANLAHDGSDEVMEVFAVAGERGSGGITHQPKRSGYSGFIEGRDNGTNIQREPDTGTAARFFYCAKASRTERDAGLEGMPLAKCGTMEDDSYPIKTSSGNLRDTRGRNTHPTVKPLALMQWLVRLVCSPNGIVLDNFLGSGTTGLAAIAEGRKFIGIEREPKYFQIAVSRIQAELANAPALFDAATP